MTADPASTPSGIAAIGHLAWGSHFCLFYETGEDLRSAVVPYVKAGLESHERCIWVTAEPLGEDDARNALRAELPELDHLERDGQIEIRDARKLYLAGRSLAPNRAVETWLTREQEALRAGYRGLRITGDASWLAPEHWPALTEYECAVHRAFQGRRVVALCSYDLARCSGADLLEIAHHHEFALARRTDGWEVIESAAESVAKAELRRTNEALERRLVSRTAELQRSLDSLRESERRSREILEALPAAIYTTDAEGRLTFYNRAAADFAGHRPELGSDRWCVSWRLYHSDGTPMPHDDCPMAVALREKRPVRDAEAVAERPDGTRVPFLPYPTPLTDAEGRITGAVNMLVDFAERKSAEGGQRTLLRELNHSVKNNLQTIYSLLKLAQRKAASPEAGEALGDVARRVAAIGAAQSALYEPDRAAGFDAPSLVAAVCDSASGAFGQGVTIETEADPGELPNDSAVPLALVLIELLTNAARHAAGADGAVAIEVGLRRDDDTCVLTVADDGPGFEPTADRKRSSGLDLVEGLAQRLGGRFAVESEAGARCTVAFPLS